MKFCLFCEFKNKYLKQKHPFYTHMKSIKPYKHNAIPILKSLVKTLRESCKIIDT